MVRKLSPLQQALVERLRKPGGGSYLLIAYSTPGCIDAPHHCFIEHPYSDEDGRTVGSLIDRRILRHEGENMWVLAPEYCP